MWTVVLCHVLSLGKIREYKGEEELETSACMAKPAFVGVLAKPAWLPAVCRVSVCPRPTSCVGVCGRRSFGGGLNALLLGVLVGTSLGEGLQWDRNSSVGVGRSGGLPLLWVFNCVLEEPFSSARDSSISKVRCCLVLGNTWRHNYLREGSKMGAKEN